MTNETFKSLTKQQQMDFLNPLFDYAKDMILAGVLLKNVVNHFLNKGLPLGAATNIMEMGKLKAEDFSHYKFK